jgi:hypothetical protein
MNCLSIPHFAYFGIYLRLHHLMQPIINVAENSKVENAKMDRLFLAETFAINK